MNRSCSVDDCDRKPYAHGICEMHYKRVQRHGTTERIRGSAWTEAQISNLRRIYEAHPAPFPLPPAAELVAILGHTSRAISAKAQELNLTNGGRSSVHRRILDRPCAWCATVFRPSTDTQATCSGSCGQKHRIATLGHNRGMKGKQHTEATKNRLSEAAREVWARANPAERAAMLAPMHDAPTPPRTGNTFSRTRSGKRADLGGLFVRSSWEANYARYLNWLMAHGEIESWEYEPKTFQFPVKRGNRSYTPDFRVVTTTGDVEWHEVKGWMTNDSRIKLERFARHYPDETLVLIDEKAYRELAKAVASLIDGWEMKRAAA